MVNRMRWLLQVLFFGCAISGAIGGVLALAGHYKIGGPLLGIGVLALIVCLPLDFVLSWFSRPRPEPRGFEVKLVTPTDRVSHE